MAIIAASCLLIRSCWSLTPADEVFDEIGMGVVKLFNLTKIGGVLLLLLECRKCDTRRLPLTPRKQCCGAETICFRSGSDFQKVSTPAPDPAPATALELPLITDFILKSTFFMFLMKENRPNSHARSYST
jgi:hypothetical protein